MVFQLVEKLHLQIYASQFMTSRIILLVFPFESEKCGKEGEKLQKIENIENEKSFFDEVENIFHSF